MKDGLASDEHGWTRIKTEYGYLLVCRYLASSGNRAIGKDKFLAADEAMASIGFTNSAPAWQHARNE